MTLTKAVIFTVMGALVSVLSGTIESGEVVESFLFLAYWLVLGLGVRSPDTGSFFIYFLLVSVETGWRRSAMPGSFLIYFLFSVGAVLGWSPANELFVTYFLFVSEPTRVRWEEWCRMGGWMGVTAGSYLGSMSITSPVSANTSS